MKAKSEFVVVEKDKLEGLLNLLKEHNEVELVITRKDETGAYFSKTSVYSKFEKCMVPTKLLFLSQTEASSIITHDLYLPTEIIKFDGMVVDCAVEELDEYNQRAVVLGISQLEKLPFAQYEVIDRILSLSHILHVRKMEFSEHKEEERASGLAILCVYLYSMMRADVHNSSTEAELFTEENVKAFVKHLYVKSFNINL